MTTDKNTSSNSCIDLIKNEISFDVKKSNVTFNSISVSVIPRDAEWYDMEGFTIHKYGPFSFDFKDKYDNTVAGIELFVSYNCKGSYEGHGSFLSDVFIAPKIIFANHGYYLTCNVNSSSPINYGTKAEPIAGIRLQLQMEAKDCHNNAINKFLIVSIRGDCQVSIIVAEGY